MTNAHAILSQSGFNVVVAKADWTPSDIIVADASICPSGVKIEPRDRMCVEDEDGLKNAIKQGATRFQTPGFSMQEALPGIPPRPGDEKTRLNAWRYLIVPVPEKTEGGRQRDYGAPTNGTAFAIATT